MNKSVQKSIRLSSNMFQVASDLAEDMGLSFQNYVRYLIYEDLRRVKNPIIDKEKNNQTYLEQKQKDRESYQAEKNAIDVQKKELGRLLNEYANTLDYND